MSVLVHSACVPCMCCVGQNKASDPLGPEVEIVVSFHADAGKQTQALCRKKRS